MNAGGARDSAALGLVFERDRELDCIARAVAAAAGGAGSIVAVEGEAGIGKSLLLAHARCCAREEGVHVLGARGGELERTFAYGIARQLFEGLLATAKRQDRERWLAGAARLAEPILAPSASLEGAGADPAPILHGLYWLVANLSVEQAVLIVVDDAHWADDPSVAFLSYLARRVDELAVVIVYATRIGEGASDRLPALAQPDLVRTVLRPAHLSRAATARLIAQALSQPSSERFACMCHSVTSGNPFLLRELLRALDAHGIAPDDAGSRRVEQIAPDTIARATLARLRSLGPAANQLASAVAVLGASAELRHAAALARLQPDVAAEAADALVAAAILRDGRPLEFIHPIVRTAVYQDLGASRRATMHKRAARLLAREDAEDIALAPHLLAVEPAGDPWVVERLRAAAKQVLARGAPEAACTYFERAHDEPPPQPERLALLLEFASAEVVVARPTALEHLREVLAGEAEEAVRFDAAHEMVWALVNAGRTEEAVAVGSDVLAAVSTEDEELCLQFEGWLAAIAQLAPACAKPALERLAPYEGRLRGETTGERLILACLAYGAPHRGESPAATARLAELALGDGRLLRESHGGSPSFYLAVWALIHAGRLDVAERHVGLAIEHARQVGSEALFGLSSACRCQILLRQGRLADAEAEALSALDASRLHAFARAMLLSCLLHTMIERVDAQAWPLFLREHDLDGDLWGVASAGLLLFARGHLRLAGGDARAAADDFANLRRRDELASLDTPSVPARASLALAHAQLGNRERALALAEEELVRCDQWDLPSLRAFALRTLAVVEGGAEAIERLRESVVAVQGSPAGYEHALSLTEFGAALRRAGHRRDAQQSLREALELADRCGALRLAGRARQELVALGARPRRAALSGRDALTPSERRVAQLAAAGCSNRDIAQALFVTVRTVEGHLTQTYMKLGIGSREQLEAALSAAAE